MSVHCLCDPDLYNPQFVTNALDYRILEHGLGGNALDYIILERGLGDNALDYRTRYRDIGKCTGLQNNGMWSRGKELKNTWSRFRLQPISVGS